MTNLTFKGREKLCKGHSGAITLPKIVKMALGKGGVNEDGTIKAITGKETALYTQLIEKDITDIGYPTLYTDDGQPTGYNTTASYKVTLTESELVGESVSEQGLFDEDGDLVAYKTFLPKGKDGDVTFVFEMQEIF